MGKDYIHTLSHLKKEWDFKKNKLSIHEVTTGSGYKAWWKCQKCNHEWQAKVVQRVRGSICPHCAGRFEFPFLKKCPDLEKEWDFQRNDLSIHDVTTGSKYNAWWGCQKCGHEWQAMVQNRVKGNGCPHCAGRFEIPLLEKCPELEKEWDFQRNDLSIHDVAVGSAFKAWWKCQKCNHEWQAKVAQRVRGTGCPHCAGRFGIPLLEKCPELEKEWVFQKNMTSIHDVTTGSNYKAWWKCQKCGHEWQAKVQNRVKGTGCPHCNIAKPKGIPALEKAPHLENEFISNKNGRSIYELTYGSNYKAWWKCQKCDHEWQAEVRSRVRGSGCPHCAGKNKIPLLEKHPSLEKEWDFQKNKLSIYDVTTGSNYKAWWKCQKCGHEWQAKVVQRVRGTGCPHCAGRFEIPLLEKCPELKKEWVFQKNMTSIHDVAVGSNYNAWWKCQTCDHEWQARIDARVRGTGCPHCAGQSGVPFLDRCPELEKEWDSQKNKIYMHDVTTGSQYKVWWKCQKCNHEWQAKVQNRVKGTGCPHCAGRNV